jgi:hypothetical protein
MVAFEDQFALIVPRDVAEFIAPGKPGHDELALPTNCVTDVAQN